MYVLATGIKGLQLAGAPVWIPDLFNGLALLIAVAVTARQRVKKVTVEGGSAPTPVADAPDRSTAQAVPTS